MIAIVGFLAVFGAVVGGYVWEGGHVGALIQPAELLIIGGAAIGSLIVMSPKKVLVDLARGILQAIKGSPYNKRVYEELFKMLYDLSRLARRDGVMALEGHLSEPHSSTIFAKYPAIANNHHAMTFIVNALMPIVEGTIKPEKLPDLLEMDIRLIEEEHHAPLGVLSKTADALPGFGIVAAVMGIVITMGAIDGPPAEIGEKVGAALVGTFLGILLSYGYFAPMAMRLDFLGVSEIGFLKTIAATMPGFIGDVAPKVALEQARRGVSPENRPTREEMDELFREVEGT